MNNQGLSSPRSRRGSSAKPALVLFVTAILSAAISLAADAPRKSASAEVVVGNVSVGSGAGLPARVAASPLTAAQRERISKGYGNLPLAFEQNDGQTDPVVDFFARGGNYRLFLTGTEAVLSLDQARPEGPDPTAGRDLTDFGIRKSDLKPPAVVRMQLVGGNPGPEVHAEQELGGKSSYFIGNDPSAWRRGVSRFGRVRYEEVYPGVDLVYHGRQGRLEYDFVVSPGADPESILLRFTGADELEFEADGSLRLQAAGMSVRQKKPFLYQMEGGERVEIAGAFVRRGEDGIGFEVGPYDRGRELVIDPEIVYSTYLGGLSADLGRAIAVDSNHNAYVAGSTASLQFPASSIGSALGAEKGFQPNELKGIVDAYVLKLDPSGSEVIYSVFLGGDDMGQFIDTAEAIQVDADGNAYFAGLGTAGYPVTEGSLSDRAGADDVDSYVITKLNPAGDALVYSTRVVQLVGVGPFSSSLVSGFVFDIALDAARNVYFTGGRIDPNGLLIWVGKVNAAGSSLTNGVVFGPSGNSAGIGIALDGSGNIYVTGSTDQMLPTTMGAFQGLRSGGMNDAFVLKLNSAFQTQFLTYLGGDNNETGRSIAAAADGRVFVTGFTGGLSFSSLGGEPEAKGFASFPTTASGFDRSCCGEGVSDAFFVVLDSLGTQMLYGTLIGGNDFSQRFDVGYDLAIDSKGYAHIVGAAAKSDFPVTMDAFQPQFGGGQGDAFYAIIDPTAAGLKALVFSSLMGGENLDEGWGLALDEFDNAYLAGFTGSREFPTTLDSLQPVSVDPGDSEGIFADAFAAKIGERCLVSAAAPTSIDFGVVPALVRSAAGTVRLTVDRAVMEFGAALSDEINFEVDFQGRRISPTELEFDVYFLPQTQGMFTATVDFFAAGDANRPACRQRVTLKGQTLTVSADPARIDFTSNEVACGAPAGPRVLNIINTSSGPITLTLDWRNRNALRVVPGDRIVLGAAGTPTATAALVVTYLTPSESPFTDTITFSSGGVSVLQVPVTAPACGALLSIDPLSLTFGTLPINGSQTLPVTVSSASVGNLAVTVSVPGGQPFQVSQTSFNVSSTAPVVINVTFQPGTVGFFNTAISFNATGGTVDLAVSGSSRFDMIQITGVNVTVDPSPTPIPTVGVQFGGAPTVNLRGRLQLSFAPDNANLTPDPLMAFVDTGNNQIDFRVPAGSTTAAFLVNGNPATAPYQPGTIAGTLTFRLVQLATEEGNQPVDFSGASVAMTRIEPAAPVIRETTCQRAGNTLTVVARGLSTTREITAVNFNLTGAPGANLTFTAPAATFANVPIAAWYGSEGSIASGSTIAVRVPFTFQGDFAALGQATISFGNGVGTSNVGQVNVSACQ